MTSYSVKTSYGRSALLSTAAAALLFFASGCTVIPYPSGTPLYDDSLSQKLMDTAQNRYPSQLRTQHRSILTKGNIQLEMTGYILARRPGDIRVIAMNDFGGTYFELLKNQSNDDPIVQNPVGIPKGWLENAILRDIEAMYLRFPTENARLVRHKDGVTALSELKNNGQLEEFRFDTNHNLTGYAIAKNGRWIYRIDYSNYKLYDQWQRQVPETISITDYLMDYRFNISVLKLIPDELKDELFQ